MRLPRKTLVALASAFAIATPAAAQSDFYRGKTVQVVVGAKGGSLTLAGQIVARNLGKHIPGNPNVIFVNKPGGAHINATNHILIARI